ncbi:MAG: TldD/PmbA family protein [Nanoarchaeota archaeon]
MEILPYLLKKLQQLGAEDVVLQYNEEESTLLKFANDKLVNHKSWTATGTGIFVAYKKRIVSTSLHENTTQAADAIAKKTIELAKLSEPNPNYHGIAQGFKTRPPVEELYDPKVKDAELVDIYQESLQKAQQYGATRNSGILQSRIVKTNLLTSGGIEAKEEKTGLYYSIRSFTDKDASGHGVATSNMLAKFKPQKAAQEAAETAVDGKNPKSGIAGKYDILFHPHPISHVWENIGQSVSPYNVDAGFSCLKNKVGEKIGSDLVTLHDDARLKNGFHSTAFDAEGVPSQDTCLIKKGVFQTYLHNTSTAHKYGVSTTGNAGLLSPEPSNLVVSPGDQTTEEMIQGMKKGLYVTNVWYTRFQNYEKGDFSTIPRDGLFYIENGKIQYPVKELRISENLLRILKNVIALGRKSEQVYSWEVNTPTLTPHVLVKDCNVTKPTA